MPIAVAILVPRARRRLYMSRGVETHRPNSCWSRYQVYGFSVFKFVLKLPKSLFEKRNGLSNIKYRKASPSFAKKFARP